MTVNGVLRDSSQKTFRGTIDFKTGSSGAVGAETEDVLLLGETVVNKTVPLILCAEEDVKGSHGATIGQLDEEMLFYLGSRGISEGLLACTMRPSWKVSAQKLQSPKHPLLEVRLNLISESAGIPPSFS